MAMNFFNVMLVIEGVRESLVKNIEELENKKIPIQLPKRFKD